MENSMSFIINNLMALFCAKSDSLHVLSGKAVGIESPTGYLSPKT